MSPALRGGFQGGFPAVQVGWVYMFWGRRAELISFFSGMVGAVVSNIMQYYAL